MALRDSKVACPPSHMADVSNPSATLLQSPEVASESSACSGSLLTSRRWCTGVRVSHPRLYQHQKLRCEGLDQECQFLTWPL